MRIKHETVADIVKEASEKMSNPSYTEVMVGGFVQQQAPTAQYIGANAGDLGGQAGVINTIFHCALLSLCFQRENNRSLPTMTFEDLNHVATGDRKEALQKVQPALLDYIEMNVEHEGTQKVLMLIALAMQWAS